MNTCQKCSRNSQNLHKVFHYTPNNMYVEGGKTITFDVDFAYEVIAKFRPPVECSNDPTEIQYLLDQNQIEQQHVDHVDPNQPGLIFELVFTKKQSRQKEAVFVLVDGNHRAARSLRDGHPFCYYLLHDEHAKQLILKDV